MNFAIFLIVLTFLNFMAFILFLDFGINAHGKKTDLIFIKILFFKNFKIFLEPSIKQIIGNCTTSILKFLQFSSISTNHK